MSKLTLKEISEFMRDIDICMLTTKKQNGMLESRPMSNNREVDYNGDSYFFSSDSTSAVQEIAADPQVNLSLVHRPALLGKPFYLSVAGQATLIHDRAQMEKHWVKDLDAWFENGINTPGLVMIHVKAKTLVYWHGMEQGELTL